MSEGLGFKNKYKFNVNAKWPQVWWLQRYLRDMLYKCHDNNVFLTTNQILCFPRIERRSHSAQQKLYSVHITKEIFGLSAVKTTPSFVCLVWDSWEWNGPIFARFEHILSFPERIVAWSRLQRRTWPR